MKTERILICDDDSLFHLALKQTLEGRYHCKFTYNTDEAISALQNDTFNVLLLDIQMRSSDEGLNAIPRIRENNPDLSIIMVSGLSDFSTVQRALRLGAQDYVRKDADPDELLHVIERACGRRRLETRARLHSNEVRCQQDRQVLVGSSAIVEKLRQTIDRARKSNANVVITGETGTGKEVVSRLLRGTDSEGNPLPFVAVDSSTIQSNTAESQLFGHEKGAFTGALMTRKGCFEEADGGILYFDEISNMPFDIQAKLLRAIQEREITRMGSSKPIHVDIRVICATNQKLETLVEQGKFRPDLLERLNVIPIQVPPLRERTEDIPLLINHFTCLHAVPGKQLRFSDEAVDFLKHYPWPGNIRELSNLVAFLTAMTDTDEVDLADLPPKFREKTWSASPQGNQTSAGRTGFYSRVAEFERAILSEEYQRAQGNISKLAMALGMDRSHLHSKLKAYGIHVTAARSSAS